MFWLPSLSCRTSIKFSSLCLVFTLFYFPVLPCPFSCRLFRVASLYFVLSRLISSRYISCCLVLFRIVSSYFVSPRLISFRLGPRSSYFVLSHHISSVVIFRLVSDLVSSYFVSCRLLLSPLLVICFISYFTLYHIYNTPLKCLVNNVCLIVSPSVHH